MKSGGLISHPGRLLIGRPKSEDKHSETGWAEGIHDATMNLPWVDSYELVTKGVTDYLVVLVNWGTEYQ